MKKSLFIKPYPKAPLHAFMQAMGLVNDHIEGCGARAAAEAARAAFVPPQ
jgi:DNA-3-methyladenine glycosylase I